MVSLIESPFLIPRVGWHVSKVKTTGKLAAKHEMEHAGQNATGGNQSLAQPADGGTPSPASGSDSPSRRQLHGDGGGAGGRGMVAGATRPPHSATRYLETSLGILSYRELAPILGERITDVEVEILERQFAHTSVSELLLELHRRICGDLTPQIAGRWRLRDVQVGAHEAPPHTQVPVLMHNYIADLEMRLESLANGLGDEFVDVLSFAEGRLLYIHPFEDFNGRVSRLFLKELLYRLELPVIDTAAASLEERRDYFEALQAYDQRDPRPLTEIWRRRIKESVPR